VRATLFHASGRLNGSIMRPVHNPTTMSA
jgi:hypothetical protein